MSTPTERVREFLRQYELQTYPSQQVQTIHGRRHGELLPDVHLDHADLRAVLGQAEQFEQAERAATVPLIDTRDGAPITRKDDESPTPALALPLDLPEGVESPEELGQIFDAPSRQELELYRAHMDDRDVHEDHREEREAGFSEGWTRAYYLITQTPKEA